MSIPAKEAAASTEAGGARASTPAKEARANTAADRVSDSIPVKEARASTAADRASVFIRAKETNARSPPASWKGKSSRDRRFDKHYVMVMTAVQPRVVLGTLNIDQ